MINKNYLNNLTQEQREELRLKSAQAREEKKLAAENIVLSMDDGFWRELCSKYGFRMPMSVCQSSEHKYVKRLAKKLGVDVMFWVRNIVGATTLKEVSDMNPNIGAVGMCGLLIEAYDAGMFEESGE